MSENEMDSDKQIRDFAFYYPGHLWYSGDWIKNLLLFFDGIALLVPNYKVHEPELLDPTIAGPLLDRDMLKILEAETHVDQEAATTLAETMTDIIASGTLDHLAQEKTDFHALSYSRLGGYGDAELAGMILEALKTRNLARDSEDGLSIPMHPMVRALVLVLLSQILRSRGEALKINLAPATDRAKLVGALCELLAVRTEPTAGGVVAFDLETVGVDLSDVPIDEILSYREEHVDDYRSYSRSVRHFVRALSLLPDAERVEAFASRQAELSEIAQKLRTSSRKAWKRPASFALSLAGAAWTLATGNPIGALLSAGSAVLGRKSGSDVDMGAYSYIFRSHDPYV